MVVKSYQFSTGVVAYQQLRAYDNNFIDRLYIIYDDSNDMTKNECVWFVPGTVDHLLDD